MTYAATGLRCLIPAVGGGPAVFIYSSADAHGTVSGAGYLEDGDAYGMKADDVCIVVDTNVPTCTIHHVASVTAGGAATLTAATLS